jgi:hypothetical protein|tara:strand:- start:386 stop:1072 length:687 start_codon:yes stop_codon:yes gene_type:complete
MALEVNELGEATFSDEDVKAYLNRSTLAAVAGASFVTKNELETFTSREGGFVHDGSVFSSEIDSIKHALEYTHTRTSIVHNGFENFQRGLNEETPIFFAHVASRGGGLAVIKTIIESGSVGIGEKFAPYEDFTLGGNAFLRGSEYSASGTNKVSINDQEYDLPVGKFGKSLTKNSTFEYPGGSTLIIEAQPQTGYEFIKWKGEDTSTERTLNLVLEHNLYIEATFKAV